MPLFSVTQPRFRKQRRALTLRNFGICCLEDMTLGRNPPDFISLNTVHRPPKDVHILHLELTDKLARLEKVISRRCKLILVVSRCLHALPNCSWAFSVATGLR